MLVGDIAKFETLEDGSLIIEGIASTPATDHEGERISPDALRKAIPEYLRSGSIREMHKIAAGKPLAAFVDDEGKMHLRAKIVDLGTITKIKEGILKEFSVGGKRLKQIGNEITELLLKEVSVVDHGCNPNTSFSICKMSSDVLPSDKLPMKDELLKALKEPDVIAALAALVPKAEPQKPEELAKMLGLEDLQKSLKTLETKATEAANLAAQAERANIVAEASRDGKVIPLSTEDIAKMDVTLLKNMVTALPKVVPTQKTIAKITLPSKEDERATFIAQKRAEGAEALTKMFKDAGFAN